MQSIQQFTQTQWWQVRDYLAPVLRESKFKEHGRITPEEFVAAGDFLCYKFPTWSWEAGDANKRRDFLPATKQYLISRNVPCLRRASQMVYTDADEDAETMMSFAAEGAVKEGDEEEEWAVTHTTRTPQSAPAEIADIPDLDAPHHSSDPSGLSSVTGNLSISKTPAGDDAIPDIDDIPDMDDEDLDAGTTGVVEEEDAAQVKPSGTTGGKIEVGQTNPGNLVNVRTYDCLITYDKYYQTPRMWLQGYSESRTPLSPAEVFSDVSPDYAQKTVTIEPFPHLSGGVGLASVHPCKHASVMRKVIERMDGSVREAQAKAGGANLGTTGTVKEKEKKKWGIGGAVKKVTGGGSKKSSSSSSAATSPGLGPTPTGTDAPAEVPGAGDAGDAEVEGLRVDQYLLVFLKFISSVVPTIEIDSTTSV